MNKKIVYIAHPISGDIEANLKDLARILRIINTEKYRFHLEKDDNGIYINTCEDIIPVAPYYADIIALDDNIRVERERGIANDVALIRTGVFDELWLTGSKVSFGMKQEEILFKSLGKKVFDYTNKI